MIISAAIVEDFLLPDHKFLPLLLYPVFKFYLFIYRAFSLPQELSMFDNLENPDKPKEGNQNPL